MTETLSGMMPTVELPSEWAAVLNSWHLPDRDALFNAFTDLTHPVNDLVNGSVFAKHLRTAIRGPKCCATITYHTEVSVRAVGLVVSTTLGEGLRPCPPQLDPPLIEMPSREIAGWKREWHTDGLPWDMPNRYTVVGITEFDEQLYHDARTEVLPLSTVLDWPGWAKYHNVFASHQLNWRCQPTDEGLPALNRPMVDGTHIRWHGKVFRTVDDPGEVGEAFAALGERIDTIQSGWTDVVVKPGQMMALDNTRALHRAPRVTDPQRRKLLRIKLGGNPDARGPAPAAWVGRSYSPASQERPYLHSGLPFATNSVEV